MFPLLVPGAAALITVGLTPLVQKIGLKMGCIDQPNARKSYSATGRLPASGRRFCTTSKSLNRWLWAQDRYALLEAQKQLESSSEQLGWNDRIRRVPGLSAPIILVYCLILKGGLLDGWAGWHYAFQRIIAELILSIRLIEMRSSR